MQYILTILFFLFTSNCFAAEQNLVKASLIAQNVSPVVDDKQDLILGVNLKIQEGWHLYWEHSGDAGAPTKIIWDLPVNSNIGPLRWPAPERFAERGNITTFGYRDEVTIIADASLPVDAAVKAEVRWLVCKDICIPGSVLIESEKIIQNDAKITKAQKLTPQINSKLISEITSYKEQNNKYLLIKINASEFDPNVKLEENIQVFTDSTIPVTAAQVSKEAWLRIPINSDLSAKPSGIVVFSSKLTKSSDDISAKWDFSEIPKFSSTIESTDFSNLTYRSHGAKRQIAKTEESSLPFYVILFYALAGGLILNIMPCVLPVISIKVLSFVENSEKSSKEARKSVIGFSTGVIACFILLAAVVSILRNAGVSVGWGFQFQYPEFVFCLIVIIFILALGFFDLYSIGTSILCKTGQKIDKLKTSFFKDFLDGALATALSTPCSAPLLGVSLIVAFTQSTVKTFLIFIMIGIGLALPYALFSLSPRLIALLPKPGCWMYRVKHFMGFCLLATVIWLLFVLENLQPQAAFWTLTILLAVYLLFWFKSWQAESSYKKPFYLAYIITAFFILALIPNVITSLDRSEKINWQPYSSALITESTKQGKTVFVDFTADWCVTCKANELYTISSRSVIKSIKKNDIVAIKADWTKADAEITEALNSYGANGVPLYVVISALEPEKPNVLPTIITPSILIEAFESASIK
jgi:thiol:disulfide interchange protein